MLLLLLLLSLSLSLSLYFEMFEKVALTQGLRLGQTDDLMTTRLDQTMEMETLAGTAPVTAWILRMARNPNSLILRMARNPNSLTARSSRIRSASTDTSRSRRGQATATSMLLA